MLTMIVPTYNEKDNLEKLVKGIMKIKEKIRILIVDDNSPDGTGKIADKLKKKYPCIEVLHRKEKNGLGSAILDGFAHAKTDVIGVMDADLSHPTSLIPRMIKELDKSDIVIASRYIAGGGADEKWSFFRRVISKGAIALARPITCVKDTMSGFFILKRNVIKNIKLNPESCKICLEILAKGSYKTASEVPYIFMNRKKGQSKIMTPKEIMRYVKHVSSLYIYKITR
jgi:dolichol-phosphate mannosyltransferase